MFAHHVHKEAYGAQLLLDIRGLPRFQRHGDVGELVDGLLVAKTVMSHADTDECGVVAHDEVVLPEDIVLVEV